MSRGQTSLPGIGRFGVISIHTGPQRVLLRDSCGDVSYTSRMWVCFRELEKFWCCLMHKISIPAEIVQTGLQKTQLSSVNSHWSVDAYFRVMQQKSCDFANP